MELTIQFDGSIWLKASARNYSLRFVSCTRGYIVGESGVYSADVLESCLKCGIVYANNFNATHITWLIREDDPEADDKAQYILSNYDSNCVIDDIGDATVYTIRLAK